MRNSAFVHVRHPGDRCVCVAAGTKMEKNVSNQAGRDFIVSECGRRPAIRHPRLGFVREHGKTQNTTDDLVTMGHASRKEREREKERKKYSMNTKML